MLAPLTTLPRDTFGRIQGATDGTLLWMTSFPFSEKGRQRKSAYEGIFPDYFGDTHQALIQIVIAEFEQQTKAT